MTNPSHWPAPIHPVPVVQCPIIRVSGTDIGAMAGSWPMRTGGMSRLFGATVCDENRPEAMTFAFGLSPADIAAKTVIARGQIVFGSRERRLPALVFDIGRATQVSVGGTMFDAYAQLLDAPAALGGGVNPGATISASVSLGGATNHLYLTEVLETLAAGASSAAHLRPDWAGALSVSRNNAKLCGFEVSFRNADQEVDAVEVGAARRMDDERVSGYADRVVVTNTGAASIVPVLRWRLDV